MDLLWIEFINSDWHDHLGGPGADRLEDRRWLDRFLKAARLPELPTRRRDAIAALRDLRDLLQRCADGLIAGVTPSEADLQAVNEHLASGSAVGHLSRDDEDRWRLDLEPAGSGVAAAIFAITMSFARFLVDGDPTRLRRCENPDCRWLFYDLTRSRTRRWCADSCGSLMKVRRFRDRRRSGQAD